jgi:hypothetical protein
MEDVQVAGAHDGTARAIWRIYDSGHGEAEELRSAADFVWNKAPQPQIYPKSARVKPCT